MFATTVQFLFSAFLVCIAWFKLSVDSSNHTYLIDPNTLTLRASGYLEVGPTQNLAAGKSILQELLVTNVASAEQWSQLGSVLVAGGETEKGRYCYSRAALLAPNSVETMLSVTNFFINTKQVRGALPYLGKILSHTSQYDATVFNDFETLKVDFDEIAAYGGMPSELRPAQAYLEYVMADGDLPNARKAWAWMKSLSPDDSLAAGYVNFVLGKGLPEEAAAAWLSQLGKREPDYGKASFIFNGDFEHDPSGPLFDWRITPLVHVHVNRDESVAHSGHSSLRIDFDGKENVNYQGVSQRVFLWPGTYRFEAFVRTEGISTNEGVGLKAFNVETEKLTGTNDWKRLEATLVISSVTTLAEIQVIRHSSQRFDSKIAGTAWIDGVSLLRVH